MYKIFDFTSYIELVKYKKDIKTIKFYKDKKSFNEINNYQIKEIVTCPSINHFTFYIQ